MNGSNNVNEPQLVTTVERVQQVVTQVLIHCSRLAVDCEGVALSREGRLCLLQVSTGSQTFLFDVCILREELFSNGMKDILESTAICKIMHDCRNDSDALWWQYGVKLRNVIDTQVAFRILREQQGFERQLPVKLTTLLKRFTAKQVACEMIWLKTKVFEAPIRTRYSFWSRRPLSLEALQYAAFDVEKLLEIADNLMSHLSYVNQQAVLFESERYTKAYRDNEDGSLKARLEFQEIVNSIPKVTKTKESSVGIFSSFWFDKQAILHAFYESLNVVL